LAPDVDAKLKGEKETVRVRKPVRKRDEMVTRVVGCIHTLDPHLSHNTYSEGYLVTIITPRRCAQTCACMRSAEKKVVRTRREGTTI
jgi:hypothetical protein